jgi:hypothetical protein
MGLQVLAGGSQTTSLVTPPSASFTVTSQAWSPQTDSSAAVAVAQNR